MDPWGNHVNPKNDIKEMSTEKTSSEEEGVLGGFVRGRRRESAQVFVVRARG